MLIKDVASPENLETFKNLSTVENITDYVDGSQHGSLVYLTLEQFATIADLAYRLYPLWKDDPVILEGVNKLKIAGTLVTVDACIEAGVRMPLEEFGDS